jgi:hypothetical protein
MLTNLVTADHLPMNAAVAIFFGHEFDHD